MVFFTCSLEIGQIWTLECYLSVILTYIFFYFVIIEGSLSHKKNLIDEIQKLSLFEHFKVTGAILPPHTGAILYDMKTDLATRLTDP